MTTTHGLELRKRNTSHYSCISGLILPSQATPTATSEQPPAEKATSAAANEEHKPQQLARPAGQPANLQPFKEKEFYRCPYVSINRCKVTKKIFNTFQSLCAHASSHHRWDALPTTHNGDPFENGTRKILYPERLYVTYREANEHGKSVCKLRKREGNKACPWPDCTFEADSQKSIASHIRHRHSKDTRGAFQCSKCEVYFHYDLYKLAVHEERCNASPVAVEEKTTMRSKLNAAAERNEPPTFIVINRSSNRVPERWKADIDHYQTGLPKVGKAILEHFAAKSGHKQGGAVLHSAYECPTRRVPALQHDLSYLGKDSHQQKMVYRGFKFTQAIVSDISAANQAGVKPFVVSQDVDGRFCRLKMMCEMRTGSIFLGVAQA
jgi:hypothetical protein